MFLHSATSDDHISKTISTNQFHPACDRHNMKSSVSWLLGFVFTHSYPP